MLIEDQVVSLEWARKLREKLKSVGVEMETAFVWAEVDGFWIIHRRPVASILQIRGYTINYLLAPTLTEMLELLPRYIKNTKGRINQYELSDYAIRYIDENNLTVMTHTIFAHDKTFNRATACAKLTIWLIDNGHWPKDNK